MFFIYGAHNSKACDRAEFLLYSLECDYRFYVYKKDYTLAQLRRIVPGAETVPQIFYGTKYLGGVKELYEFLYPSEYNAEWQSTGSLRNSQMFNLFTKDDEDTSRDSSERE